MHVLEILTTKEGKLWGIAADKDLSCCWFRPLLLIKGSPRSNSSIGLDLKFIFINYSYHQLQHTLKKKQTLT